MRAIPNDDKYFKYYNANPKDKVGCDCVVRAICTVTDRKWDDVVNEMTAVGLKYGYLLNDPHCIEKYLKMNGFVKMKEPRTTMNRKMAVRDFLSQNKDLTAIANVGSHHMAAIIDSKVYDIWNSSKQTMHSYWVREND